MKPRDRLIHLTSDEALPDGLIELAGADAPDYRDDILRRVAGTRQRPAWTFIERWLPMTLVTTRPGSPPMRALLLLALTGLVLAGLVASVVLFGSQLTRSVDPDRLNGRLLVPTIVSDEVWDAAKIPGLSQPSGLDVGPDGNLYAVNAGSSEIIVLDPDGEVVTRWGSKGIGDGQFIFQGDPTDPMATFGGVAVAPDGSSVYVTDDANDRVQRFDSEGSFEQAWGGYGTGDGQFLAAFDVSAGPEGDIFVVDNARDDVQRFDARGAYLGRIAGGSGNATWSLNGGITVDDEGNLFSVDYGAGVLRSWSEDGIFRWSIGEDAEGPARLVLPGDVATDGDGYVYVSEPRRVVVFRPDGTLASTWDAPADAADEEWLPIAVGTDGAVYLSARSADVIYRLRTMQREPMSLEGSTDHGEAPVPGVASTLAALEPTAALPPVQSIEFGNPSSAPLTRFAVPFTLELPPGWDRGDEFPGVASVGVNVADDPATSSVLIQVFAPTMVNADPCRASVSQHTFADDSDADTIAFVLAGQPGLRLVTPMADIAIDGYSGTSFDQESLIDTKDCDDSTWLQQWTFRSANGEENRGLASGQHHRLIVLDVGGIPVIIEVWSFPWTSREHLIEADAIIDSIDFR